MDKGLVGLEGLADAGTGTAVEGADGLTTSILGSAAVVAVAPGTTGVELSISTTSGCCPMLADGGGGGAPATGVNGGDPGGGLGVLAR